MGSNQRAESKMQNRYWIFKAAIETDDKPSKEIVGDKNLMKWATNCMAAAKNILKIYFIKIIKESNTYSFTYT